MNFAFVACNRNPTRFREDASYIYRCENLALGLRSIGHQAELLHLERLSPFSKFDVVVFHRPRHSARLVLVCSLFKRRKVTLIADYDDLVFDERYAEFSPGVLNGLVSLDKTRQLFKAARRALGLFDRVTVSTPPLVDHVHAMLSAAAVCLLPNAVHFSWRQLSRENPAGRTEKIITYFPGTRSHDRDFAGIAPALTRFLQRHEQVRLQVTGPLQLDLPTRPHQLLCRLKVPYQEFHESFQEGWVNLAPLEETPFNQCKSALKVMEAGFWNVPTICSPNPDSTRFGGAGAVFAQGSGDWESQLEALLDPHMYAQLTQGLKERVLKLASVEDVADELVEFVNQGRGG